MLENQQELIAAIRELLINRQNISAQNFKPETNIDELYKYKELLDEGVISEEEFNAKKVNF